MQRSTGPNRKEIEGALPLGVVGHRFVDDEVLPVMPGYWERAELPLGLVRRLGELMARMEALGSFALTEPEHGSGSVALETTARREGEAYVIDGTKRWIGNGSLADVVVVWARDPADGQAKGFLVEGGTPGYQPRVIEGKGSVRAVWQAHIELDGVRVPATSRLPGANSFKDTGKVLASTRVTCAFAALGHAAGAYDAALTYGGP
jgi:glutaryl-CoA dehydrogenase